MFSVRYRESMWHRRLFVAASLGDHTVLHDSSPFLSPVTDTDIHQSWFFYVWRTPRHPYFSRRSEVSARSSVRSPFVRRGMLPPILVCPTRSWSRRGTCSRIVHDRQRVLECVTQEHARTHIATVSIRCIAYVVTMYCQIKVGLSSSRGLSASSRFLFVMHTFE